MSEAAGDDEVPSKAEARLFRFKATGHRRNEDTSTTVPDRMSHKRRSHQHRRHRDRKRTRTERPVPTSAHAELPPDVAFRESLFDALADEQGAEYWQGVYGQPIHNYSRAVIDPETGMTESMDDEQYAAYVRRKMWEKSAEGVAAARETHHREQHRRDHTRNVPDSPEPYTTSQADAGSDFDFAFEIDASLKRSQRRSENKHWRSVWTAYNDKWTALEKAYRSRNRDSADSHVQVPFVELIAWPVESGLQVDVNLQAIQRFVNRVVRAFEDKEEAEPRTAPVILKTERVKWHPDKIQQKYGFMGIDKRTMEGVTAVFQILDKLYTASRQL